jgi:hypothetical protein
MPIHRHQDFSVAARRFRLQREPDELLPGQPPGAPDDARLLPGPRLAGDRPVNASNVQVVFPNQLLSALIRGSRLYLPNIGAQPEPPQIFNANVQALVYSVDTGALAEVQDEHVNLNTQIAIETAAPPPSLDKTFGNDIVAIDSNLAGDTFLIVSRAATRCSAPRSMPGSSTS